MAKQTIWKFLSVGTLGLLAFFFGVILLRMLMGVSLPLIIPKIGSFGFSLSRRALMTALLVFWAGIAAVLVFIVRALRRRHLT
jgi:hypothetical protein